jgi:hypothetical protein
LTIVQLQRELGTVTSDYWQMHLNGYRNVIDQVVSPEDLDTLNRMRARFAILSWQLANDTTDREERKQEIVETYRGTAAISEHNREACNQLRGVMLQHFAKFFALLKRQMDSLVATHGGTTDPSIDSLLSDLDMLDTMLAQLGTKEQESQLEMIYRMTGAPMAMLYAGTDLKTMMEQFEAVMEAEGMPMNTRTIPGFAMLPESSLLEDARYDSAAGRATIDYTLPEPCSVLLRIYDADGDVIESYDQGTRSAGKQSIVADLSTLDAGPYLYQLTINTSRGEQVYSKILQVVK